MLKNFINLYSTRNGTPGRVLHIGAGLCDELSAFMQLGFEQIHLVEVSPEFAEKLAAKTKDLANVEVQETLIAGDDGAKKFYRTSNPRFDSLKKPSTLSEYYPNLEILSDSTTKAQSLNALLQQYSLDAGKNNLLVLEAQGAELDILEKTSKESLQQFAWIVIKTSSQALYEQAAKSGDLNQSLETIAFELSATEELNFPFRLEVFRRNDARIKLSVLNSEIRELKKMLGDALNENKERAPELEQLKASAAERTTEASSLIEQLQVAKKSLKKLSVLNSEIRELKKTSSIKTKLLIKAQTDNESLRQKYSEKVDSEEAMIELIQNLRDLLKATVDFYGQLEKDHPEFIHEQNRISSDSSHE
jgi:FkbM family methyltransferase